MKRFWNFIGRLTALSLMVMMTACANSNSGDPVPEDNNAPATPATETLTLVYDDDADPMLQLDEALLQAGSENKFVIAQVGGNWCPWCLRFADFIEKDAEISELISSSFVYVHINLYRNDAETGKKVVNEEVMRRLGEPMRFGYPVLVVLAADGSVIHTQDSALLESGNGYNRDMVKRFFEMWTPQAAAVG